MASDGKPLVFRRRETPETVAAEISGPLEGGTPPIEPEPCACGAQPVVIRTNETAHHVTACVECPRCGEHGPELTRGKNARYAAVKAWNRERKRARSTPGLGGTHFDGP